MRVNSSTLSFIFTLCAGLLLAGQVCGAEPVGQAQTQSSNPEFVAVDKAIGPMAANRHWDGYLQNKAAYVSFADYAYNLYSKRRRVGITLAVIGTSLTLAGTVMAIVVANTPCNNQEWGCWDGFTAGIVGFSLFATGWTLTIPGLITAGVSAKRRRRVKSLAIESYGTSHKPLTFKGVAPIFAAHNSAPSGAAIAFSF